MVNQQMQKWSTVYYITLATMPLQVSTLLRHPQRHCNKSNIINCWPFVGSSYYWQRCTVQWFKKTRNILTWKKLQNWKKMYCTLKADFSTNQKKVHTVVIFIHQWIIINFFVFKFIYRRSVRTWRKYKWLLTDVLYSTVLVNGESTHGTIHAQN
jgi:hypothetical protein